MAQTSDLFETDEQPSLFGSEATPAYRPDSDKVRARLNKILIEVRAAERLPWVGALYIGPSFRR